MFGACNTELYAKFHARQMYPHVMILQSAANLISLNKLNMNKKKKIEWKMNEGM